jgi:hypothetical protein
VRNCLILGSGRSGTSMVAGTVAKAGYFMGDRLLPPSDGNPKGYFEDYEINDINEDLLASVVPKRPIIFGNEHFRHRPLRGQFWVACLPLGTQISPSPALIPRLQRAVLREPYCFKDPRFCYTLPVWRPYLKNVAFVCAFRDPGATVASILKECQYAPIVLTFGHALRAWTQMYTHVLQIHRHHGDWLFLHYNQLLSNDGLKRLQLFLDAQVDGSFPEASLNRSVSTKRVPGKSWRVYEELCDLAGYTVEGQRRTPLAYRLLRSWQLSSPGRKVVS